MSIPVRLPLLRPEPRLSVVLVLVLFIKLKLQFKFEPFANSAAAFTDSYTELIEFPIFWACTVVVSFLFCIFLIFFLVAVLVVVRTGLRIRIFLAVERVRVVPLPVRRVQQLQWILCINADRLNCGSRQPDSRLQHEQIVRECGCDRWGCCGRRGCARTGGASAVLLVQTEELK